MAIGWNRWRRDRCGRSRPQPALYELLPSSPTLLLLVFPYVHWACQETQGALSIPPPQNIQTYTPVRADRLVGRRALSERKGREPLPQTGKAALSLPPAALTMCLIQPGNQPSAPDTTQPLPLTSEPLGLRSDNREFPSQGLSIGAQLLPPPSATISLSKLPSAATGTE